MVWLGRVLRRFAPLFAPPVHQMQASDAIRKMGPPKKNRPCGAKKEKTIKTYQITTPKKIFRLRRAMQLQPDGMAAEGFGSMRDRFRIQFCVDWCIFSSIGAN